MAFTITCDSVYRAQYGSVLTITPTIVTSYGLPVTLATNQPDFVVSGASVTFTPKVTDSATIRTDVTITASDTAGHQATATMTVAVFRDWPHLVNIQPLIVPSGTAPPGWNNSVFDPMFSIGSRLANGKWIAVTQNDPLNKFFAAWTYDLQHWHWYSAGPILSADPAIDVNYLTHPEQLVVDGERWLFYAANPQAGQLSIFRATFDSEFGVTKYSGNPIIQGGGTPFPIWVGDDIFLFTDNMYDTADWIITPYTSSDHGDTWTKRGSWSIGSEADDWDYGWCLLDPCVIKTLSGFYELTYTAWNGINTQWVGGALSSDCKTWIKWKASPFRKGILVDDGFIGDLNTIELSAFDYRLVTVASHFQLLYSPTKLAKPLGYRTANERLHYS